MSVDATSFVWSLTNLKGGEKLVLLCCADIANSEGRNIYPSVATIGRRCGLSERAVQANLAELRKLKLLAFDSPTNLTEEQKRKLRTNVYRIVGMPEEKDREWREVDRNGGGFQIVREPALASEGAESAPVQNPHPAESAPTRVQNQHPDPAESAPKTLTNRELNRKGVNPPPPGIVPSQNGTEKISTNAPEPWEADRQAAIQRMVVPIVDEPIAATPDIYPPEFQELWSTYPKRAGEVEAATYDRWKRTVGWPDNPASPRNAQRLDRARLVASQIADSLPAHMETDKWQRGYQPELRNFLKDGLWRSEPLLDDDPLPQPVPRGRSSVVAGQPGVSGPVQHVTPAPPDPRVGELMQAAETAFERNPYQRPGDWLISAKHAKKQPDSLSSNLWWALENVPRVWMAIQRIAELERRSAPQNRDGRHIQTESSPPTVRSE